MFKNIRQLTPFSLTLLAMAFVMSISQSTMTTTYPMLMAQFHINTITVQWLTTGFMVAMTLAMPVSPWLLNNVSLKRLLNGIGIIFLVGTLLAMLSPNFIGVIIGRLLEGIAVGALFPTFQTIIMENSDEKRRGEAMGIVGLVMGSALAVGPIVSGVLLQWISWRALFGFFLIILTVLLLIMQGKISQTHSIARTTFDWWSALSLLGFGGLLYAISIIPTSGINLVWWSVIVVSVFLLGMFICRQKRLTTPFLDLSVLSFQGYRPAMFLTGLSYSGLIVATVLMPLLYQKVYGISPLFSGLLMVPPAFILSQLNPRAGKLLNQIGLKRLVYIGMSMMILGYLLLGFFGQMSWLIGLLAAVLLEGGNAFVMMPAITAAGNALPKDLISHGTAIITSMRQFIGAGSVVVASILIAYFNQVGSFGHALMISARWLMLMPILGIILALRLKEDN
ncbi:MAG: MFS transporter [Lactobacillaceae bacterium]|nr:MFS transporter [Lactobacillaceae bacterium]